MVPLQPTLMQRYVNRSLILAFLNGINFSFSRAYFEIWEFHGFRSLMMVTRKSMRKMMMKDH